MSTSEWQPRPEPTFDLPRHRSANDPQSPTSPTVQRRASHQRSHFEKIAHFDDIQVGCKTCESWLESDYRSACDLALYEMVMKHRGEDPEEIMLHRHSAADQCYDGRHYSGAELKIRQDLASLKVLWHNDWRKDLWFFQMQMHPVLALFKSHPLHIIHKAERAYIYLLLTLLALVLATAKTLTGHCYDYGIDSCDYDPCSNFDHFKVNHIWCCQQPNHWSEPSCVVESSVKTTTYYIINQTHIYNTTIKQVWRPIHNSTSYFHKIPDDVPTTGECCMVVSLGMYGAYSTKAWLCAAYLAAATLLFAQAWFQSAACGLAQSMSDTPRYCLERFGHFMLACWGIGFIYTSVYCIEYTQSHDLWWNFWGNFIQVKGFSICFSIVGFALMFEALWRLQKRQRFKSFYVDVSDVDVCETMEVLDIPFNPIGSYEHLPEAELQELRESLNVEDAEKATSDHEPSQGELQNRSEAHTRLRHWYERNKAATSTPAQQPSLGVAATSNTPRLDNSTFDNGAVGDGAVHRTAAEESSHLVSLGAVSEPESQPHHPRSLDPALIATFFARYDLDSSGFLNSQEELACLTTNLVFNTWEQHGASGGIAHESRLSQIQEKIASVELTDQNAWDVGQFTEWFDKEILSIM